jgi:hypothetical protein
MTSRKDSKDECYEEHEFENDFLILPARIKRAFKRIEEYLSHERVDFWSRPTTEHRNHIWMSVVTLRIWFQFPTGRLMLPPLVTLEQEAQHSKVSGREVQPALMHTPGPWTYHRDKDGVDDLFAVVAEANSQWLATITFWDEPDLDCGERAEANARLISAAPVLLDALRAVDSYLAGIEETDYRAETTRAVVHAALARVG